MDTLSPIYSKLPVMWEQSQEPVPYPIAVDTMKAQATAIATGEAPEQVWLLEHPPLYTAGTSAKASDLISPDRFPVFETGRGGQYTYHGPGQRVAYFMLDLKTRGRDVRLFVKGLEELIIQTLAGFDIDSGRREGRVGVWVNITDGNGNFKEAKIAALGVRIRRWVSFHGISINLNPDLSHFGGIVPCGIADHSVTSLHDLGVDISMAELDTALQRNFINIFGPTSH